MKLNYQLAREIYGLNPWFIDAHSFPVLSALLNNFRSGGEMELPEEKYNSVSFLNIGQDLKKIDRPYGPSWNPGQLDNNEKFSGIGVVFINGPITVSGGASSYGMDYVASNMKKMGEDDRIKGFIIVGNSGGGASAAVEIMTDCINEVKQTKPVWGFIPRGGTAASAMYGILSACNYIYSEAEMNLVGSVGTMCEFTGRKANSESPDGLKNIRIYASKSIEKNKAFEEALNNDNYEVIRKELLDPINERFLANVLSNRPLLRGTDYDNGNTKFAKDSVGTYIDGILSFSEVFQNLSNQIENVPHGTIKPKIKLDSNKMTKAELKQNHPEVYESIYNEGQASGIKSEKDRVETWMAHYKTDAEAVKSGIKSGEVISAAQREEFLVKSISNKKLEDIKNDGKKVPDGNTPPSSTEKTDEEEKEVENFYKGL